MEANREELTRFFSTVLPHLNEVQRRVVTMVWIRVDHASWVSLATVILARVSVGRPRAGSRWRTSGPSIRGNKFGFDCCVRRRLYCWCDNQLRSRWWGNCSRASSTGAERRARTTTVTMVAGPQNGTSGVFAESKHAGREATWATPWTGDGGQ
jgi:hypothetical protein